MKLPNGYGSITKLSGKRRKPYMARVTGNWIYDEKQDKMIQERIVLGYYSSRQEALNALAEYNEHPYDIKTDSITFAEVYEKWSEEYFPTLGGRSSIRTITAAYKHCSPLYNMRMKDIRPNHLEGVIKDAPVGPATKGRIKSMFNLMYRYALKYDIVEKDYAALCDSVKREAPEKEIIPFTHDEIQLLWDNLNEVPFADMVLIGIYSGWRPQELAILKTADIDLEANTMFGGLKTDAGRNRCVPIHPFIKPLIEARYNPEDEYLFNDDTCTQGVGRHLTYDKYRNRFKKVMSRLKLNHRPHEARHTFITLAKEAGMDEYILKLIVGHTITDVTEKVYTHRTMEQLYEEICKIESNIEE